MAVLKNSIYFFKGEYIEVEDVILNYVNFVNIVNDINIAKVISIRIRLRQLTNFKD